MTNAVKSGAGKEPLLIVGVGDAGCGALMRLARDWPGHPRMLAVNTGDHDAAQTAGLEWLPLNGVTIGAQGSGGDPRQGQRAMQAELDGMQAWLDRAQVLVLVAGLGGGTGTGAAPVIAAEARRRGVLTLAAAMLPFDFEGQQRGKQADLGLLALQEACDAVICLPHQRLLSKAASDEVEIGNLFCKSDVLLDCCLRALARMLAGRGVINVSFNDLCALVRKGSGRCVMACASAAGSGRARLASESLLQHPLLESGAVLRSAQSGLLHIAGGPDLTLTDVRTIVGCVTAELPFSRVMMTGLTCDDDLAGQVTLAVFVSEPPGAARSPAPDGGRRKSAPQKMVQPGLFDAVGQGRFKDVRPTVVDGHNLDIPTFIRRGIPIRKVRDASS